MFSWLFGSEDDSSEVENHPIIPYTYDLGSDGKRDEYGVMIGSVGDGDSRYFQLPDGARGAVHRNGRVAADWKRADGSHSKYAKDAASRDEAIDRLHQARKWWFGS